MKVFKITVSVFEAHNRLSLIKCLQSIQLAIEVGCLVTGSEHVC